jgi:UDP-N-acetylglucosamine--N-acetylmuramyl-(pentapeptide) pyrophosphoryl-undecaprenol N-acetylglucosamine transferase
MMGERPLTLVFAGGGTGGHLYPALAIADEIRRRHADADIVFVGTRGKIESRVVPARGYRLVTIWISGFRRRLSAGTLLFPLKVLVALLQSALLLWRKKPDVVIGTGGYVCGPVVAAAQMLGRRTLIQEQNSVPGATTRMLAPRADEVHTAFEGSGRYLRRRDNIRLSGNPTREILGEVTREEGARFFGLDPGRMTLFVFGGSRGAATINAAMAPLAGSLAGDGIQVLWQTGEEDIEALRRRFGGAGRGVQLFPFIERMEYAYAACDLAVCRSGAMSLAELTRTGVPSILIPYPHAAADHQTENAKAMVEAGAGILIPDADAARLLPAAVGGLINDRERLKTMGEAARVLGRPGAVGVLADAVERLARAG